MIPGTGDEIKRKEEEWRGNRNLSKKKNPRKIFIFFFLKKKYQYSFHVCLFQKNEFPFIKIRDIGFLCPFYFYSFCFISFLIISTPFLFITTSFFPLFSFFFSFSFPFLFSFFFILFELYFEIFASVKYCFVFEKEFFFFFYYK